MRLRTVFILLVSVGLLPKFCLVIAFAIHIYDVIRGIISIINFKSIKDRIMVTTGKSIKKTLNIIKSKNLLKRTWNLEWRCIPTSTLT